MCVYNTSTSPLECEHCYFIIFPGYSIGLVTSDKNNQWLLKSFSFIQKTKTMTSSPTASWQTDGEKVETVANFIFLSSKITADGNCSHESKRCLLLGRKAMTNLDSILKTRNITLLTKVHLIKVMIFPVVMYKCESWTIKKTACWRIDAFELWCWKRLLRVPRTERRTNPVNPKGNQPWFSLEGLMLKLKLQYFDHLM